MYYVDLDFDVMIVLRFYFGEMLILLVWKGVVVLVFGLLVELVIWYEVIFNFGVMFNYLNFRLLCVVD